MRITKRKLNSIISKIIIEEAARKGQSLKLSKRQLKNLLSELTVPVAAAADAIALTQKQKPEEVASATKSVKSNVRLGDDAPVFRFVQTADEYKEVEEDESKIKDNYYYALGEDNNFYASLHFDPSTGKLKPGKNWLSLKNKKYSGSLEKLLKAHKNFLEFEKSLEGKTPDEIFEAQPSDNQFPILMYAATADLEGEVSDQESDDIMTEDSKTDLPDGIYTLLKNYDTDEAGTFTVLDYLEDVLSGVDNSQAIEDQAINLGRLWAGLDDKKFDLLVYVKDGQLGVKQSYGENDVSGSNYTKFKTMDFIIPTKELADAINSAFLIKSLKNYMLDFIEDQESGTTENDKPYAILRLYSGTYDINVKKRGPGEVSSDDIDGSAAADSET